MLNFSAQCMDMAQSILGKNIEAINPDGSIVPVENETSFDCEPATPQWRSANSIGRPGLQKSTAGI